MVTSAGNSDWRVSSLQEGKKRLIDCFVNSVYLFDEYALVVCNFKEGTTKVMIEDIEDSDFGDFVEMQKINPNKKVRIYLQLVTLNQPKSNLFAGISDTLKREPSESVGDKSPRANRRVLHHSRTDTKSKIPKPNNVRFRKLLVTPTGLEPMLPP